MLLRSDRKTSQERKEITLEVRRWSSNPKCQRTHPGHALGLNSTHSHPVTVFILRDDEGYLLAETDLLKDVHTLLDGLFIRKNLKVCLSKVVELRRRQRSEGPREWGRKETIVRTRSSA